MTKKELIRIIETYSDEEELVCDILSKFDVALWSKRDITESQWDEFVKWTESCSVLHEPFIDKTIAEFEKYVNKENK